VTGAACQNRRRATTVCPPARLITPGTAVSVMLILSLVWKGLSLYQLVSLRTLIFLLLIAVVILALERLSFIDLCFVFLASVTD